MSAFKMMHSRFDHSVRTKPINDAEVDFDKNVTDLYQAIMNCDWDVAIEALERSPREARTWVVRHYEGTKDVMWRFLPLHSACARQPPNNLISALVNVYPDAARAVDDQGMCPLHYACGNQASREVIRTLLVANPNAAKHADPRGMLPLHHLASWGPSGLSIIDMVLVAYREAVDVADENGNTPLELAKDADHADKDEVIEVLDKWSTVKPTKVVTTKRDLSPTPSMSRALTLTANTDALSIAPSVCTEVSFTRESDSLTILRLREDLAKLRTEKRNTEQEMEQKMDQQISSLKSKCVDLENQLQKKTNSDKESSGKVEHLKSLIETKDTELKEKEDTMLEESRRVQELTRELNHKKREFHDQVLDLESERNDLQRTLGEVSEHCETYKIEAESLKDRFGSLSVSLSGMMSQQAELVKANEEREKLELEDRESRLQRVKEMLELEGEMRGPDKTEKNEEIMSAFNKQAKEMTAIAAVIAAVRK